MERVVDEALPPEDPPDDVVGPDACVFLLVRVPPRAHPLHRMPNAGRTPPRLARITIAAILSFAALACANTRASRPLEPFVWPPHAERYEADLASNEELVLAMIPTTGLVMLGELAGTRPRYVAFDPVGVVLYVFDADGEVIRSRVVDMGPEIGSAFSGGTRDSTVDVRVFDEDLFARVRWDVNTDVVTPIQHSDDEAR
jgi:hypothetical protein